MSTTRSTSKVTATSSLFPSGKIKWETELFDPTGLKTDLEVIEFTLLYNNVMYDLVGIALAKLGVEYSKLLIGEQTKSEFEAKMRTIQTDVTNS